MYRIEHYSSHFIFNWLKERGKKRKLIKEKQMHIRSNFLLGCNQVGVAGLSWIHLRPDVGPLEHGIPQHGSGGDGGVRVRQRPS